MTIPTAWKEAFNTAPQTYLFIYGIRDKVDESGMKLNDSKQKDLWTLI